MDSIKITIAANNYLFCKGLEGLINENPDFELISNIVDETELMAASTFNPGLDVIAIDLSSFEAKPDTFQRIKLNSPNLNIIAFNSMQPKNIVSEILSNGVTSYLLMCCDKEEITEALYKTCKGERFLCGQVLEVMINGTQQIPVLEDNISKARTCPLSSICGGVVISEREMEIIKLISEGLSNRQIAEKLFLSVHTVSTHRKNIMCKLGINNTAGLVMYAIKSQLVAAE